MRLVCVLAVLLASPLPARAEAATGEEQARAHFRAGQTEYARGHYREALDEFRLGYALSPRPEFLLNFAQAYRKLGEYERAIVECERFLATAPPEPLASEAQRLLVQLREEQARAESAPPDMAGPRTPPPSPPPPPKPSAPPPSSNLTPVGGTIAPGPTAPLATPAPRDRPHRRRWVVPVAVGVTVGVLAAAGIVVGVLFGQRDTYPSAPLGSVDFR